MNPLKNLKITTRAQETLDLMNEEIRRGATVWMKWSCVKCGARQTFEEPNTVHVRGGKCEECGHVTDVLQDAAANTDVLLMYGKLP